MRVRLRREDFRKSIGRHSIRRKPLNIDITEYYLFLEPTAMNIDVA